MSVSHTSTHPAPQPVQQESCNSLFSLHKGLRGWLQQPLRWGRGGGWSEVSEVGGGSMLWGFHGRARLECRPWAGRGWEGLTPVVPAVFPGFQVPVVPGMRCPRLQTQAERTCNIPLATPQHAASGQAGDRQCTADTMAWSQAAPF